MNVRFGKKNPKIEFIEKYFCYNLSIAIKK